VRRVQTSVGRCRVDEVRLSRDVTHGRSGHALVCQIEHCLRVLQALRLLTQPLEFGAGDSA
jgi:hypothetical protein